jgi:hypothetical protein
MGRPDPIFNASLTELESHRLPAAVAQAIHASQPLSAAAKELAQAQAARNPAAHVGRAGVPAAFTRNL